MGITAQRDQKQAQPYVSVIVPVLNGASVIGGLLDSLVNLDYPEDRLQILIIDNGSSDGTAELVARYPVTCLEETTVRSSYAARNRGLAAATGDIVAFTDADCRVDPHWVTEGVRILEETGAGLAGGRVRFEFSPARTTAELFDSLTNMNTRNTIATAGYAATANLFVRAALFEELGGFDPSVTSGGDVQWTQRAVRAGHTLVYAAAAVVFHPARRLPEILAKNLRVGSGLIPLFRRAGRPAPYIAAQALRRALPPGLRRIRQLAQEDGVEELRRWSLGLFAVAYATNLANLAGMCVHLLGGAPADDRTG
jgi:glycosyltransferase involved in cell wall biosynthesis